MSAFTVAQRTGEIGIRMALGADRGGVMSLVLATAFKRVAIGLALGLPLAVSAGHRISAQLYGVPLWDPAALALAVSSLPSARSSPRSFRPRARRRCRL